MLAYKIFDENMMSDTPGEPKINYEVGKLYEYEGVRFSFYNTIKECHYFCMNKNSPIRIFIVDVNKNIGIHVAEQMTIIAEVTNENILNGNVGSDNIGHFNTGDYNSGDLNTGNYNSGKKNSGMGNSGFRNTGDGNDGNCNVGTDNTGSYNIGNNNIGNMNVGNRNFGDKNIGYKNIGNYNVGMNNIGNYNYGDFNISYFNYGCFCEEDHKNTIKFFDKDSELTYQDWLSSPARRLLNTMPISYAYFVPANRMTEDEKNKYPKYIDHNGFTFNQLATKEDIKKWWDNLSFEKKQLIYSLPNFDDDKFFRCIGLGDINGE